MCTLSWQTYTSQREKITTAGLDLTAMASATCQPEDRSMSVRLDQRPYRRSLAIYYSEQSKERGDEWEDLVWSFSAPSPQCTICHCFVSRCMGGRAQGIGVKTLSPTITSSKRSKYHLSAKWSLSHEGRDIPVCLFSYCSTGPPALIFSSAPPSTLLPPLFFFFLLPGGASRTVLVFSAHHSFWSSTVVVGGKL